MPWRRRRTASASTWCGHGRRRRLARDHERHARFVDQDEVGLVHDHVVEGPLDHLGRVDDQLVAEEVEARLLRRDVGDVGGVGGAPVVAAHPLGHGRGGETEEPVDRPHPRGVASGQVVVRREHVHAASGERVERRRQDRNERLSLAGRHLREPPLVERDGGQHLDVERPEAKDPRARLARRARRTPAGGCRATGRRGPARRAPTHAPSARRRRDRPDVRRRCAPGLAGRGGDRSGSGGRASGRARARGRRRTRRGGTCSCSGWWLVAGGESVTRGQTSH